MKKYKKKDYFKNIEKSVRQTQKYMINSSLISSCRDLFTVGREMKHVLRLMRHLSPQGQRAYIQEGSARQTITIEL